MTYTLATPSCLPKTQTPHTIILSFPTRRSSDLLEAERPRAFLYPLAGRFGLRRKPDESPCSESERRAPLPWPGLPEGALPEGLLSFHLPLRPVLEPPRELPPRSGRSSRRNPPPCLVVLAPAPSEEPLSLTLPPRSELSARPDLPDLRNPLRTYLS